MMSQESQPEHRSALETDFVSIRGEISGMYVSLRCQSCQHIFEDPLRTIAGIPLGRHVCPNCGVHHFMQPENFLAALQNLLPHQTLDRLVELTEEATRITESWYRTAAMAAVLTYRGVSLGQPAERELMPLINHGLMVARTVEKRRL